MDITGIVAAASIPSALTTFLFWLMQRKINKKDAEAKREREKREKELDERDKQRQYELCQLNMTVASMALAEATAKAVQRIPDAHCNGDMDAALNYARQIKTEQKSFLNKQAIQNIDF